MIDTKKALARRGAAVTGSILGDGNIWFLILGSAVIVGISIVAIEANRNNNIKKRFLRQN